jgi:tetratricopeptide (TPR) repeat protein
MKSLFSLFVLFLCLSISLGQTPVNENTSVSAIDSLLMFANEQEERKLLVDIFEQVSKLPKEQQRAEGYKLISDNIEQFQSPKLKNRLNLFLSQTSLEMDKLEEAKHYSLQVSSDISALSIPELTILVEQLMITKQYDKVIERITAILSSYKDIQGSIKAEFEGKLLLAQVRSGSNVDILVECQKMLSSGNEPRGESLQRLHRIALKLNEADGIKVMEWLKTEWSKQEGTDNSWLALLNNLAFAYTRTGNMAKSIEIRQELIKTCQDDPRVIDQMLILALDYERKKTPEGYEEAKKIYKDAIKHPLATAEQKKNFQRNLEIRESIERGLSTSKLDTGDGSSLLESPVSNTPYFYVRITLIASGIVLIIIALIVRNFRSKR